MEFVGEMNSNPDKVWYRCTRCKHCMLFDLSQPQTATQSKKLDLSESTPYSPEKEYTVGDIIYHRDWDDIGRVMSKERASNGWHAIVVKFEKNGERRLVESTAINQTLE